MFFTVWLPLFLLLCFLIYLFRLRRLRDPFLKQMMDNCDQKLYLSESRKPLIKSLSAKPLLRTQALINWAVALSYDGRSDEALQVMNQIPPAALDTNFNALLVYHNNLANFYLNLQDVENARRSLEFLRNDRDFLRDAFKSSDKNIIRCSHTENGRQFIVVLARQMLEAAERLIDELEHRLSLLEGNYAGLPEYYERKFLEQSTESARVHNKYYQALSLEGLGLPEDAEKSYAYVAEHGNVLYIAGRARERLTQLSAGSGRGTPPQT